MRRYVRGTPIISNKNKLPVITATVKDDSVWKKNKLDFKINVRHKYIKDVNDKSLSLIKIVAYTSISPQHINSENQKIAVESWHKLGIDIYSFNSPDEIKALKNQYPSCIKFIPSTKTSKHIFGKPCIMINEMTDHFRISNAGDILMLINSDIVINTSDEIINKIKSMAELCIPIAHRNDYVNQFKSNKKYVFGFDVFFIHKKYIPIFPQSIYSMGQTWWDYWIPYTALKNKVTVFIIEDMIAFHKEHPVQYNPADWMKMTEYFKWENNIKGDNHQQINDSIRSHIINNSISLTLCQITQNR